MGRLRAVVTKHRNFLFFRVMDFSKTRDFVDKTNNITVLIDEYVNQLGYAKIYKKLKRISEEEGADVIKDQDGNVLYCKGKRDYALEYGTDYVKRWADYEKFNVKDIVMELRESFVLEESENQKIFDTWIRIIARMSGELTFKDTFHFPYEFSIMKEMTNLYFPVQGKTEYELTRIEIKNTVGIKMAELGQEIQIVLSDYGIKHDVPLRFVGEKFIGMDAVAQLSGKVEPGSNTPHVHLQSDMSKDEAKNLLPLLIEHGFVAEDTNEEDWLSAFGFSSEPMKNRIVWVKKNATTGNKTPTKKSLLDLLALMGCRENDVKDKIKDLFKVEEAKEFRPQDFTKIKKWKSDSKSKCHKELVELIEKCKNPE